jgi:hypothetical protein
MIHVAVLKPPYIRAVLDGRKTVEARLTRARFAPYLRVSPDDRLYFKQTSGPFRATAVVTRVLTFADLDPKQVRRIRSAHNDLILGDPAYWAAKRTARYATLIWFDRVEPITMGPTYSPSRQAWHVLPDSACVYPDCLDR